MARVGLSIESLPMGACRLARRSGRSPRRRYQSASIPNWRRRASLAWEVTTPTELDVTREMR
jgi:hypothetical protein